GMNQKKTKRRVDNGDGNCMVSTRFVSILSHLQGGFFLFCDCIKNANLAADWQHLGTTGFLSNSI
ncbi:hypothetical protein, partial [Xenorhabdus szentirmaii]|uniref:hypothetical protein n=1 Tax=Xenorhabdus szentirmaii TaxID=290112 RepID=UPI002B4144A3